MQHEAGASIAGARAHFREVEVRTVFIFAYFLAELCCRADADGNEEFAARVPRASEQAGGRGRRWSWCRAEKRRGETLHFEQY